MPRFFKGGGEKGTAAFFSLPLPCTCPAPSVGAHFDHDLSCPPALSSPNPAGGATQWQEKGWRVSPIRRNRRQIRGKQDLESTKQNVAAAATRRCPLAITFSSTVAARAALALAFLLEAQHLVPCREFAVWRARGACLGGLGLTRAGFALAETEELF